MRTEALEAGGFMKRVNAAASAKDSLAVYWLGQAGFILKTPGGLRVAIDPYLSDLCERLVGFKRITPTVARLEDFDADVLLLSHEHPDHCDTDLLESMAQRSAARVFGSPACRGPVLDSGFPPERFVALQPGDRLVLDGFTLLALPADHGPECPGALGFILDFGFTRVYFAGDTALSPGLLRPAYEAKPELALLPINGEYGNLSAAQAALLATDIGCETLIPCHFWTFVEHGSCPKQLLDIAQAQPVPWRLDLLAQGEGRVYGG